MIVDTYISMVHVEIFHETPAKDKGGVRERFAKVIVLFEKNDRLQIKEFRWTAI